MFFFCQILITLRLLGIVIKTLIYKLFLTKTGRYDLNKYFLECQDCNTNTDPFTVPVALSSGFWPGNAKSMNYLFQENVLRLWDMFRKFMPGSSEQSFLRSLNSVSAEHCRVSICKLTVFV